MGTADIEITGMNECRGHVTKHFDITKKIENCNITIDDQVFFTGEEVTPSYSITDGDKTLVEGQDYSVSFSNNIVLGTATATFKGEGYYTDTVDKTFEIVEKDHVWNGGEVTKEATCTEDGVRTFTCKGCGETRTEVIASEGHKYSTEYTVDKQPTCTEKGSKSHHCTVCGDIETGSSVDIDMVDHEYGNWEVTKEATCTRDGSRKKVCKNCGDTITEVITAEGHDWNGGKITEKATCTEDGIKTYTCLVCGDTKDEIITALGHSWDDDYTIDKAASCTEEGVKSHHCVRCDKIQSGSEVSIPKVAHSYGEWTVTKAASYTAEGTEARTCKHCGAKQERSISKLPKVANTMTVKAKTNTVKFSKLKKKNQTIAVKKAFTVSKPQGKVTYKVKTYDKKAKKKITVSSAGKVTIKKGLKKGTYKVKVNVTAAGTSKYKALTKTVTLTIKVK